MSLDEYGNVRKCAETVCLDLRTSSRSQYAARSIELVVDTWTT